MPKTCTLSSQVHVRARILRINRRKKNGQRKSGESDPKGGSAFPQKGTHLEGVARASVRPLAGFPRYPPLWGDVSRATARGNRNAGIRLAAEPESVSSKRGNTNRKGEGTAYFPESKLPAKGSLWNRRKFLFPRHKSEGKRKAEISNPGISRVVRPILTDHGSEGLLIFLRGDRQGQATTLFE